MNTEITNKAKQIIGGIGSTGGRLITIGAKIGAIALLAYVVGMLALALYNYSGTKSSLISHGISNSTAILIAWAVMLIGAGLPTLAIFRIMYGRGRPYDYGAAMLLPLISWAIAQFPANFDQSGLALQYCSDRPDGTLFCLDHAGVDPLTRAKLEPMDATLAQEQFQRKNGLIPKRISLPVAEIVFFDVLTGHPKVWVHQNDQGCFDLFDNPGADPQSGEPLTPVTKQVVQAIKKCVNTRPSTAPDNELADRNGENGTPPTGVAVVHPDCRVFPILNMSAMTVVTPYDGGCQGGLAEGEGGFSYRVRERVHVVRGEFHGGKLNGNATITEPDKVIEGEFRENLLWNTITRGVLPGGIRFAAQVRNGASFAICRADRQEERNCTDRTRLLGI